MSTSAPDAVKRLVDRFDLGHKVFLSGDYKAEQLRAEFLNPFFTALGWDMNNTLDTIRARNWGSVALSCLHRSVPRGPMPYPCASRTQPVVVQEGRAQVSAQALCPPNYPGLDFRTDATRLRMI
jgi:hypothetical protein